MTLWRARVLRALGALLLVNAIMTAPAEYDFDYDRLWPAAAAILAEMDLILASYREDREAQKESAPVGVSLAPLLGALHRLHAISDSSVLEIEDDPWLDAWAVVPSARDLLGLGWPYAREDW